MLTRPKTDTVSYFCYMHIGWYTAWHRAGPQRMPEWMNQSIKKSPKTFTLTINLLLYQGILSYSLWAKSDLVPLSIQSSSQEFFFTFLNNSKILQ